MSSSSQYVPAKVWQAPTESGGQFSNINRPASGATHEKVLPAGKHPFQLHSLATPNGVKVSIMFEELLEKGISEAEYDAYPINIMEGDQFGSGFVEINPNSKIPALIDHSATHIDGSAKEQPLRIFESGAILMHLAEKFNSFLPQGAEKAEVLSWLFWQMGSAPFLGGGFGHFYAYAPEKFEYPINRYTMEVKRQLDVLDKQLANNTYISGEDYTIADMAIWPWYGALVLGELYDAAEFLEVHTYRNVVRWAKVIADRPAVQRGKKVNRTWGEPEDQVAERHSCEDFIK
ncbi:MAG: GST-like protein [Oleispira sp.]|jgi:GST-like protein